MSALLEITSLGKSFGGLLAVTNLSLSLDGGELLTVIGPNGCGKTTFFNLLTGHLKASQGDIRLDGQSILALPPHKIARLGVGRKFQVPSIYEDLTVAENIRLARQAAALVPVDFQAHRDAAEPDNTGSAEPGQDPHEAFLEQLGLAQIARQRAGTLSHGKKQWLEIAMVLQARPRLILLDEPTAGMTRQEKQEAVRILQDIQARFGAAIIVIEHDMTFVEALRGRVAAMLNGRLVADGDFEEVRQNRELVEAYLGGAAVSDEAKADKADGRESAHV
ncbi:ABC transporter ATP-binding protein [Rhodovibrionaceae bacterium A322]